MISSRWFPLFLAALLAVGAVVIGWFAGTNQIDQWQLAARYTARVGFPVFIIAYAASSLFALWPGDLTRNLLRFRRQWGLAFAFTHSVHLVALNGFDYLAGRFPNATTLVGGGGAYAIMYVMALTSNDWSMRALGKWWKFIHRLGIHWLWFIFTFSYLGRLIGPDEMGIAPVFFPVALAALGLRIAAWLKRRRLAVNRA